MAEVQKLAQILTIFSGKGGSGKTTFALSMASLLSKCDLKVLLIDCDRATNGGTLFFERVLPSETDPFERDTSVSETSVLTLDAILNHKWNAPLFHTSRDNGEANENFVFIPTNTHFSDESGDSKSINYKNLIEYLRNQRNQYDVIICDCQAGYSDLLAAILPFSTVNLVPMEPDAISTSAIRVLYARLSRVLKSRNTFLVFNKIFPEEYEILEPVSIGMIFTMLSPVWFNMNVRQAFNIGNIPQMETTDAKFGRQIHTLLKDLLPTLRKDLEKYSQRVLEYEKNQLEEQERQNDRELSRFKTQRKTLNVWAYGLGSLILFAGIVISRFLFPFLDSHWSESGIYWFSGMFSMLMTAAAAWCVHSFRKGVFTKEDTKKQIELEEKSEEIEDALRKNKMEKDDMETSNLGIES